MDLWCSVSQPNYTGDTLTNVFSSTKSLTAIAMASLVDKVGPNDMQIRNILLSVIDRDG